MFLLDLILSFFMGDKKNHFSPEVLVDQFFNSLKKILQSLIIVIICSVLFCLMMGYLIDRTLTLIDSGNFYFSNSIILLLALIIIDLIVLIWSLSKIVNKSSESQKKTPPKDLSSGSPIESAVAALIFDYVKEREAKRNSENTNGTN